MSEEKTEKPTPKKKKESKKEGQVPRTQELGGWAGLLVVGMALPALMGREITRLRELMVEAFTMPNGATVEAGMELLREGGMHILFTLVLLGSGIMVVGTAGALAQGGFYLATKSLKPKLSKLDPIKGAKRIFGPQALWEGAKMLLKSSVLGIFLYLAVKAMMPLIGGLVPIPVVISMVADTALGLIRNVAVAGLVMAAADYAMQRRKVGKQTRMTKHEVKQEHKNSEGDPLIKSAIRSRQLAAARNRMFQDIPEADVLLVNPTHVAIALRYDAERGAPKVVARGAGESARKIREKAAESNVPLVRDVPLARALYSSTQVGQEIPQELYAAVAQVLAFVITRRTHGQSGGEHRSPRTEADLPAVPAAGRRRRAVPVNPSAQPALSR
jgi:flagellar biosynthetic protein FlhB